MSYVGDSAIEMEPVETENVGSLARLVMSELPGCGDFMVRQQLGFALREFCRETDACTFSFRVPPSCGVFGPRGWTHPVVCPSSGMEICTVLSVKADGQPLEFSVEDRPTRVLVDAFRHWVFGADSVEIAFSAAPKAGGEECPSWFKDRYAEAITAGAMFNLLSMTGKAWSDPQRAAQYGGKYHQAIAEAAYRRLEGSAQQSGPASAIPCGGLFM